MRRANVLAPGSVKAYHAVIAEPHLIYGKLPESAGLRLSNNVPETRPRGTSAHRRLTMRIFKLASGIAAF